MNINATRAIVGGEGRGGGGGGGGGGGTYRTAGQA